MDLKRVEITIHETIPDLTEALDHLSVAIAISGRVLKDETEVCIIQRQAHQAIDKIHRFLIILAKATE